ncbi:hypothetical protein A1QC_13805 [Vibrio rumoiensis 1S-45]|uniref:Uncharacterized protein n=1 Tax=Vibrio rumoiensis 1S-45 TaxID=1188252 RepID=A0A1E5DYC0_9VIBR|nr:hypothetical protein A1QC_13805 [Vibrio rumoiensis 1S-45]
MLGLFFYKQKILFDVIKLDTYTHYLGVYGSIMHSYERNFILIFAAQDCIILPVIRFDDASRRLFDEPLSFKKH